MSSDALGLASAHVEDSLDNTFGVTVFSDVVLVTGGDGTETRIPRALAHQFVNALSETLASVEQYEAAHPDETNLYRR